MNMGERRRREQKYQRLDGLKGASTLDTCRLRICIMSYHSSDTKPGAVDADCKSVHNREAGSQKRTEKQTDKQRYRQISEHRGRAIGQQSLYTIGRLRHVGKGARGRDEDTKRQSRHETKEDEINRQERRRRGESNMLRSKTKKADKRKRQTDIETDRQMENR